MATLSICVTCRDGNENEYGGSRGGARFAESFLGHARLEPGNRSQINALYELIRVYKSAPEGFLRRRERPEPLRGNILGRIPPLETMSDLVVPLPKRPSETFS